MEYKKRYDPTVKDKWQILEKTMLFVGKKSWVIHSTYNSPEERNEVYEGLVK